MLIIYQRRWSIELISTLSRQCGGVAGLIPSFPELQHFPSSAGHLAFPRDERPPLPCPAQMQGSHYLALLMLDVVTWICQLTNGFLQVVTWTCQNWYLFFLHYYMDPSKLYVFFVLCHRKPSWTLTNESKYSMPWASCAFGNVLISKMLEEFYPTT